MVIGISSVQTKKSLKQEKIWTRSSTTPLQIRRSPDTNTTKRKREKKKNKCTGSQGSLHEIKNNEETKTKRQISNDKRKKKCLSFCILPYNGRFDEVPVSKKKQQEQPQFPQR
jgi:hypothetical protein